METGDMQPTEDHYEYGQQQLERMLRTELVHPGDKVLDFGAGLGRLALPIKELGCQVVYIEQHDGRAEFLRSRGLKVYCQRDCQIDEADFDLAMVWFVLQHQRLAVAKQLIGQLAQRLRPGGLLLFSYPTDDRGGEHYIQAESDQDRSTPERDNAWSRWMPAEEIPKLIRGAPLKDLRPSEATVNSWVATRTGE